MKRREFIKAIPAAALLPAAFSAIAEHAEAADAAQAGAGAQTARRQVPHNFTSDI